MPNSSKSIEAFPEDEYVCTLSDQVQNNAFEELREEPHLRQQAIESMRQYIEKQQHIIKCRMDSRYLLRFLRAKKFSIPAAQESLDKFICVRNRFPEVMQHLDPDDPVLAPMIDLGICTPMPGKDKLGRTIILSQMRAINPQKHTADEILQLFVMIVETLLEDENNQIHGFVILCWAGDTTLAHAGMWPIPMLKKFIILWEKSLPLRNKGIDLYNAPKFIVALVELLKSLLSKKLAERIHFFSNLEELSEAFPKNALPKELGGEQTMKEIIDGWKGILKNKRQMLLLLDEAFEVNEHLRPKDNKDPYQLDDGVVGSFRKLEID